MVAKEKKAQEAIAIDESPFASHGWKLIEQGYCVVPIAPGSKKPGRWSASEGWQGMGDWTRFASRQPTEIEIEHWNTWPGAGIGLVLGATSGVIGIDRDYDIPGATDALDKLIPFTPAAKKGQKGYTKFFRYNGEKSTSFDVNGQRVMDVLSDGRQTVMPPTIHPCGCSYVWITEETLESLMASDLPTLPENFFQRVAEILAPSQTEQDKLNQKLGATRRDTDAPINTDLSIQAQYFKDLNREALNRLDEWVPKLVPTARRHNDGYRCIATWRNAENPNVGIHPSGIRDWGGGYGMSAIDLILYSNNLTFHKAAEALRSVITMSDAGHINFSGRPATQPSAVVSSSAHAEVKPLPWQVPKQQPPVILLPPTTSDAPAKAIPAFVIDPPGIIGDIARWITATAPKQQPELSVAAAIALCATVMQRIYRSNLANFTSLYVVMVAKSTEGKEHPQSCVEKILTQAELTSLIAGSGYTSSGAVFSALIRQPSHIAVIDEMGKLMKLSRSKGNANSEAAIDKLVEAFGRLSGVMRPPVYSTMTMTSKVQQPSDRVIHNPAITILGATTPNTFYENLTKDLVQDGFLGRLLVVESTQPRQLARFVDQTDPPAKIIDWCKEVHAPALQRSAGNLADVCLSEIPAVTIGMHIGEDCQGLLRAFEGELNDLKEQFEGEGLDVLLGRTYEKALRLSMIAAKAVSPKNSVIHRDHLEWAINFCRHFDMAMVRAVRRNQIANSSDGEMKKLVQLVKHANRYRDAKHPTVYDHGGIPHSRLLKLSKLPSRQFRELIDTAYESGILNKSPGASWGYAGDVYFPGETD